MARMTTDNTELSLLASKTAPPYIDVRISQEPISLLWRLETKTTALIHRWHTDKSAYYPHQLGNLVSFTDKPSAAMINHALDLAEAQVIAWLDLGEYPELKYDRKSDTYVKTGKMIKFNDWMLTDRQYNVLKRKSSEPTP